MDHIAYTEEVTTTISSNNNIVQTFETIEPKGDAIKNILVINEVRKGDTGLFEKNSETTVQSQVINNRNMFLSPSETVRPIIAHSIDQRVNIIGGKRKEVSEDALQSNTTTGPINGTSAVATSSFQQQDTTVDEMKIQTMYKMVDDIAVNVQGQNVLKKVLYLTNNQAALFDEAAMERCIQALDFGEPKFIIRLSPSHGVASQEHIAHEELEGTPIAEFTTDYALDSKPDVAYNTSELDKLDERVVQTQVILFMKTCILPLAHRTRATIFISGVNDCYLGTALAVVAIEEQARLGKDCPFNVIATAWQGEVHSRAVTPGDSRSLAAQILRGSTAWKRRLPFIQQTFAALALSGDDQLQRCDLTLAASHYILFECIDEENGDFNFAPMNNFDSAFMSCLMKKVPSIVIQSHCISDITSLSDYALRGIPVLLLDSTERAVTLKNVPANYEPKTILAKKSNAFPDIPVDRLHKIKVDSSGSMDLAGRQELLDICCSMIEDKWAALTAAGVVDALDSSLLAFLHRVLHFKAGHNGGISVGDVPLYARIRELEKLQQANKESKIDAVPLELASRAVTFIQTRDLALKRMAQLNRVEMWMQRNNDSHALWEEAASYRDDLLLKCEEIKANDGLAKENVDVRMWLVYFNVLTSPCVFSGSIHDIEELKQTLSSVAKIDRLPTSNSLEALRIISDAWDHVETYSHMADSYKRATKISYQLLLVCGVLVTLAVIFQSSEQNSINFQSRIYIIALSFFTSGIAAYVAFVNPAVRWQQLRAAAVTIESNVWMFRTRTGDYRATTNINDVGAEEQLKQMIQTVKTGVLDGADIKNSAFFSRSKTFNEHKQHGLHDAGFGVQDSYFGADDSPKRPGICERLWSCCFLPQSSATVAPSVSNARVSSAPDALSTVRLDFKRTGDIEHNGGTASVYECASLAQFLDKINSSNPEDKRESVDNHYHPLKPEHYIKYRAVPILNFYKNRIPRCHTIRNATQVLLVLSGMATGVLAILDLSVWAAVVSAVSAAVVAYTEFKGNNSKLSRYSSTVHSLQELLMWWETLPQIDRSVVANVDYLVQTCEDMLMKEQQAWRSTSQAVKMLQKAVSGENKEVE